MENTLLSELTAAQSIIKEVDAHYDMVDDLEADIQKLNKKIKHRRIAVVVIGLVVIMMLSGSAGLFGELLGLISIGGIVFALYYLYKDKSSKAAALNDRINEEQQLANDIINDNIDQLAFLPDEYWYPMAIDYIVKVVESGRATDLNQALSMCDDQIHRWKVEAANAEIQDELKRQTEELSDIKKENAAIATINLMHMINRL